MPKPDGYIDVSERIQAFYANYPDGSLVEWRQPWLMHIGERSFICYTAAAYRTADDSRPGIGTAWEPVPGPTPFTRDSEFQNAETAAWGRAIAALGFEIKQGIATSEDVSARDDSARVDKERVQAEPSVTERPLTEAQNNLIAALLAELEQLYPTAEGEKTWLERFREYAGIKSRTELTVESASAGIDWLTARKTDPTDVPF